MRVPSYIYLYDGSMTEALKIYEIVEYMKDKLGNIKIERRLDFVSFYLDKLPSNKDMIAEKLALSRIKHIDTNPIENVHNPPPVLPMEIEYERQNIFCKSFGVLYDGFRIVSLFSEMISEDEFGFDHCHIVFTNQLVGTWDENDSRYHARVSVYSFPSIISTTGIVEAPAKPREYYLKQRLGIDEMTLKNEFKGRFIDYDNPHLTEVMKGYVMQALFFHMMGEPFCGTKNCRLYNAHWQEDVIRAQLGGDEFCDKHRAILSKVKK